MLCVDWCRIDLVLRFSSEISRVAGGVGFEPNQPTNQPSDPKWNPNADITEDDIIDMTDIGLAAMHYGETHP